MSERPLDPERTYLLKHTTRTVRAAIEVVHGTDLETLTTTPARRARPERHRPRARFAAARRSSSTRIATTAGRARSSSSTRVTNDTVGAGMIARAEASARTSTYFADTGALRTQVSPQERRERLGQKGLVVRVHAPTAAAARQLAFSVERELFDRGRVATVVLRSDGGDASAEAAEACASAGLVALVPVVAGDEKGLSADVALERLIGQNPGEESEAELFARRVAESVVANSR